MSPNLNSRIAGLLAAVLFVLLCAGTSPARGQDEKADGKAAVKERDRLLDEAQRLRAAGKTAEAIAAAEKALAIERAVFGNVHEDLAETLRKLAELHVEQDAFQAARNEAQEALTIQTKLHDVNHWKTADAGRALDQVALVAQLDRAQRVKLTEATLLSNTLIDLYLQGKGRDAIALGQRARVVYQQLLGDSHPDYAACLNNLGILHHSLGDYRQAEPFYDKALEICKAALGERHPDYVTTFTNLAVLQGLKGEYEKALPLYRHALELRRQVVGENHPDYVRSVNNLAWLHKIRGEYGLAEPLYVAALNLHKQGLSYGRPHTLFLEIYRRVDLRRPLAGERDQSDLALIVGNLAVLYHEIGDYVRAEPLYRQALEIYKQTAGEKSTDYARTLNNLAGLYQLMGDQARAESLLQQAVALRREALGETHPDYATSLHNLGRFYHMLEDYDRAEALFLQALAIRKEALGVKHPYYAQTLDKLARLYHLKKDYARAEALYSEALEVRKQALGEKHRYDATIVTNQALLYQAMGEHDRAESLFQKSLDWTLKEMGEQNQEYARTMYHLAMLQLARKKYADGERLGRQSVQTSRQLMERCAAIQSERQQLAMSETTRYYLDGYLTLATAAGLPTDGIYAEVLAWKGAVTIRQQTMHRLRRTLGESGQPEALKLHHDLEQATRRLAALSQAIAQQSQPENLRQDLDRLSAEIERLEQALAGVSETFRQGRAQQERIPAEVARALPMDTALIDLLEYNHFSPPRSGKGELTSERWLAAFVLRPNRPIERVGLGPVAPIAEAVESWRALLRTPVAALDGPARALRKLVWEPLEAHLKGVATVIVSPDGVLGSVPLAALPGKKAGAYLIEEYTFAVVPVPRMLNAARPDEGRTPGDQVPSLLLVGDVEYGGDPGKTDPKVASRAAAVTDRAGLFADFAPLASTGDEIASIGRYYRRRFPDGKPKELDGPDATEEAFRREAPKQRYLHLATHGYFAPATLRTAFGPEVAGRSRPGIDPLGGKSISGFHPGLLSGIVLAGANRRPVPAGADDGILTALEVASLDLSGCDLAVLSACETGLGATAGGEGLLGLQRAFQVAGAHAVVASLWSVGDEPTRALMARFYENLWRKNLPPRDALREAQLYMLREGLGRGVGGLKPAPGAAPDRTPPFFWAAFVLSTDRL